MRLSEHFDSSEFDCHGFTEHHYCNCGGQGDKMDPKFIEELEKLRYNIGGLPLYINSGFRCLEWNKSPYVGGAGDSQHCHHCAADIAIPAGLTAGQFKWYAMQLNFDGIGIYPRDYDGNWIEASRAPQGWLHLDGRDGCIGPYYFWEG